MPVAWETPDNPVRSKAVVMCLSCHRAHGSEYPDMLRWDYNTMIVNDEQGATGTGCFVCHSSKDDFAT
ncbi:cytochrome c3 family protein [Thermodesulfobacteriota bacterium]